MKRLIAVAAILALAFSAVAADPPAPPPKAHARHQVIGRIKSAFHGRALMGPRRLTAAPVSVFWQLSGPVRNQLQEGSCTGNVMQARNCYPDPANPPADNEYCRQVYFQAQREDGSPMGGGGWPGAVPFREGSTVAAAMGVAQEWGWCTGATWAFTIADIVDGLQTSPAIVGTDWWSGMEDADAKGYIHVTGNRVGGHCYVLDGCTITSTAPLDGEFSVLNSWGDGWANNGRAKLTFKEAAKLFKGLNKYGDPVDGEAAFYQTRTQPPGWNGTVPTPEPSPAPAKKTWWDWIKNIFGKEN